MKLLFFILLVFVQSVFAEEPSEGEVETYLGAVKEQQVEDQLLESEQVKKCKADAEAHIEKTKGTLDDRNSKIRDCFAEQIKDLDEKSIQEYSDKMDLKGFDLQAAKSTTSIKEYLQKRLSEGLRGKNPSKKLQKLKDQKFVSHDVYVKLYKNQIGKTILLDISNYCLQNFGLASDPRHLFVVTPDPNTGRYTVIERITAVDINPDKNDPDKLIFVPLSKPNRSPVSNINAKLWKDSSSLFREYKACNNLNDSSCISTIKTKKKLIAKPVELLSYLKNAEFEFYKDNPAGMGERYKFCAGSVIQNMCEIYKCNNVYNPTNNETNKSCLDLYDIDIVKEAKLASASGTVSQGDSIKLTEKKSKGRLACNLQSRLKNYRKTFEIVEKTEKAYKEDFIAKTGVSVSQNFKGVYRGNGGDGTKSVDEITSISSTELVNEVSSFDEASEEAKKLREKCYEDDGKGGQKFISSDKECQKLLSAVDQESLKDIEVETEAETALYLKKLETVKDSDEGKEALTEFLKENGIYNKYKGKINELSKDDLLKLIQDNYKAEKLASLKSLQNKFEEESKLKPTKNSGDLAALEKLEGEVSSKKLADLENHKKKIETLYQYSNIVSSYLNVTSSNPSDDKVSKTNSISRTIEIDGAKNYGKKDQNSNNPLTKYFSNEDSDSSGSSAQSSGSFIDISFIDQVLGNKGEETEDGN